MSKPFFGCFGEAMIRFAPMENAPEHLAEGNKELTPFWRSIGGDELNVAVALSRLGIKSRWISALGDDPHGKLLHALEKDTGVEIVAPVLKEENTGTFFVVPEEGRVFYNRKFSAFARHDPSVFEWKKLTAGMTWLHMTGITPMLGERAVLSWQRALDAALGANIPCSIDFNWRPQLGTLESLWATVKPYASRVFVIVLSLQQLAGLVVLEGITDDAGKPFTSSLTLPADDPNGLAVSLLKKLQAKIGTSWLACCFKKRTGGASSWTQTRWSVIATSKGVFSTISLPVVHRPLEEIGGGSAWFAGLAHFLMENGSNDPVGALRRADLLAALCQETRGDHSQVTRDQLLSVETKYAKQTATVISQGKAQDHSKRLDEALEQLRASKAIAIIRGKNPRASIERGIELAKMGCGALEITMDTPDVHNVLKAVIKAAPKTCMVGVGTITHASQVPAIAALGARFALAPINPPGGFVQTCLSHGVLPVPAASTPNEIYSMWKEGAKVIKLFPAGQWSPKLLTSLKEIGEFSQIEIIPSGSITPQNYSEWLKAGAIAVGVGSNLAGNDIKQLDGTSEFEAARREWQEKGRSAAQAFINQITSSKSKL